MQSWSTSSTKPTGSDNWKKCKPDSFKSDFKPDTFSSDSKLIKKTDPFGFDDPPNVIKTSTESPTTLTNTVKREASLSPLAPEKISPLKTEALSPAPYTNAGGHEASSSTVTDQYETAVDTRELDMGGPQSNLPATIPSYDDFPSFTDSQQRAYLGHDSADLFTAPTLGMCLCSCWTI